MMVRVRFIEFAANLKTFCASIILENTFLYYFKSTSQGNL